jgi:protein-L-isoaspartate(D-aspartate) O-methyltransferase
MERVPRHRFVPAALQSRAYEDGPLPIGEGQTISQPYIVALMAQAAQIQPQGRILEIGTGSGYSAAILAELGAAVYTVERLPKLAQVTQALFTILEYKNITCLVGDGSVGWSEHAPYDAIIVTAGAPAVPNTLMRQLALGGILVIPVGDSVSQSLLQIRHTSPEQYTQSVIQVVRFVPLIGQEGW